MATAFRKRQRSLAFLVATLIFLALHQARGITSFPWDSGGYWSLSAVHSLLNPPETHRGYLFPFLLSPARWLSDVFDGSPYPYRLFSSIAYGAALTGIMPALYSSLFGGQVTWLRRLVVPFLVALLFPGGVIYPLSDLPALLLLGGGIVLIVRSSRRLGDALRTRADLAFAGILLGAAYSCRTIYLLPMAYIFLLAPFFAFDRWALRARLFGTVAILAGVLITFVPQALINASHHVASPMVVAEYGGRSIFASQLAWGIAIQRYETSIEGSALAPTVFYRDAAGEALIRTAGVNVANFRLAEYFDFVIRHPIEFAGIIGRHTINGLDLRDGSVYVSRPSPTRNRLAAFNFLVLFVACFLLSMRTAHVDPPAAEPLLPSRGARAYWLVAIFLPAIATVPGAVETRFFLPVHMLAYCTIAFRFDWRVVGPALRRHYPVLVLALLLSFLMFATVTYSTMSSIGYLAPEPYRSGR